PLRRRVPALQQNSRTVSRLSTTTVCAQKGKAWTAPLRRQDAQVAPPPRGRSERVRRSLCTRGAHTYPLAHVGCGETSGPSPSGPAAQALLQRLCGEAAVVERQQCAFGADDGLEDDLAAPQAVHVAERLLGVLEVEIAAVVLVDEIERALVAEVGILDADHGDAGHADVPQQLLLDIAPPLLVGDLADDEVIALGLILEQVEGTNQRLREVAT